MGKFSKIEIDWSPFVLCKPDEKPPYPRGLNTPEGLGDRLRYIAFEEKQAGQAFFYATEVFPDVPDEVKKIWLTVAKEERKHLQWLLWRMEELKISPTERPVTLKLWKSFDHCESPEKFAVFMANSEERGRIAGEQFYQSLIPIDPLSARLFQQIATEEREHIRLAKAILDYNFDIPKDFSFQIEGLAEADYATFSR